MIEVEIVCEAAGNEQGSDIARVEPAGSQHDELPAIIGGLGLSQMADILPRQCNAVIGHDIKLLTAWQAIERPLQPQHITAPEPREQINETRTADAARPAAADRMIVDRLPMPPRRIIALARRVRRFATPSFPL